MTRDELRKIIDHGNAVLGMANAIPTKKPAVDHDESVFDSALACFLKIYPDSPLAKLVKDSS
jgi:hypothetical protein